MPWSSLVVPRNSWVQRWRILPMPSFTQIFGRKPGCQGEIWMVEFGQTCWLSCCYHLILSLFWLSCRNPDSSSQSFLPTFSGIILTPLMRIWGGVSQLDPRDWSEGANPCHSGSGFHHPNRGLKQIYYKSLTNHRYNHIYIYNLCLSHGNESNIRQKLFTRLFNPTSSTSVVDPIHKAEDSETLLPGLFAALQNVYAQRQEAAVLWRWLASIYIYLHIHI